MTNKLTSALLLTLLSVTVSIQAQSNTSDLSTNDVVFFDSEKSLTEVVQLDLNDFSHKCDSHSGHESHNHIDSDNDVVMMDSIMKSDEGADFNCSGGFCMDKSHYHKKGLTLKRQLFNYFMKISC